MQDSNITRITLGEKELILVGTAHVSKRSAELVKEIIEAEQPDSVCVELDAQRYQTIMDGSKWKEMDIFKVIKEKKATLLLLNLVISSFQKRLAKQFGIKPGQEMIQGIESAKDVGAKLVLADRNIQVTFSRIWQGVGLWVKLKLLMAIVFSIFSDEEMTEEDLERLKSQDMLSAMLDEFTTAFPKIKTPLIDERDRYLAQKIKEAPGNKVVAVLGAAHIPGVTREIHHDNDLTALSAVPPKSKWPKVIAWAIPILIIGLIAFTFTNNPSAGVGQTLRWILWNGSFSAIGAALAFAHPLAILTAFVVAPISSLNPLMAAGWFAGIVQAYLCRPNVESFESLAEDVFTLKGFWNNKITRILLIVTFTNLGSTLGTVIGGADIIRSFLENI